MKTWILVAGSAEAFLYQTKDLFKEGIARINSFTHPESREKESDLVSDRAGHYSTSHMSRGAFEQGNPKDHEAEVFAIELAKMLEKGRGVNQFERVIIVAQPHFHGLIKKHIHFSDIPIVYVDKDYTKLSTEDLTARLKEIV